MLLSMGSQRIGHNLATEQLFLMILYLWVCMVVVVQLLIVTRESWALKTQIRVLEVSNSLTDGAILNLNASQMLEIWCCI